MRSPLARRRVRFGVPVAVAGAIALAAWVPTVMASATPNLPPLTSQQLVAKVLQSHVHAFSGTISVDANLGLPDLSGITSAGGQGGHSKAFDPTTLLSGTHQIKVWERGADQRLALPSSLAETDFVHTGHQAWLYDSATQAVTHFVPAGADHHGRGVHAKVANPAERPAEAQLTPDQVAQKFLDQIGPSTAVSVAAPVYVAGRSTYQLDLAPKPGTAGAANSTVSQVAIAVDSATGMPLQVKVGAQGQKAPALHVGFSSISFTTPSTSEFAAPTGTTTKTKVLGGAKQGGATGHRVAPDLGGSPVNPAGRSKITTGGSSWAQTFTFHDGSLSRNAKQLDEVTSPVSGAFGSARLLTTNLASALVFPDGRIMVGLVTPHALEAAAGG